MVHKVLWAFSMKDHFLVWCNRYSLFQGGNQSTHLLRFSICVFFFVVFVFLILHLSVAIWLILECK